MANPFQSPEFETLVTAKLDSRRQTLKKAISQGGLPDNVRKIYLAQAAVVDVYPNTQQETHLRIKQLVPGWTEEKQIQFLTSTWPGLEQFLVLYEGLVTTVDDIGRQRALQNQRVFTYNQFIDRAKEWLDNEYPTFSEGNDIVAFFVENMSPPPAYAFPRENASEPSKYELAFQMAQQLQKENFAEKRIQNAIMLFSNEGAMKPIVTEAESTTIILRVLQKATEKLLETVNAQSADAKQYLDIFDNSSNDRQTANKRILLEKTALTKDYQDLVLAEIRLIFVSNWKDEDKRRFVRAESLEDFDMTRLTGALQTIRDARALLDNVDTEALQTLQQRAADWKNRVLLFKLPFSKFEDQFVQLELILDATTSNISGIINDITPKKNRMQNVLVDATNVLSEAEQYNARLLNAKNLIPRTDYTLTEDDTRYAMRYLDQEIESVTDALLPLEPLLQSITSYKTQIEIAAIQSTTRYGFLGTIQSNNFQSNLIGPIWWLNQTTDDVIQYANNMAQTAFYAYVLRNAKERTTGTTDSTSLQKSRELQQQSKEIARLLRQIDNIKNIAPGQPLALRVSRGGLRAQRAIINAATGAVEVLQGVPSWARQAAQTVSQWRIPGAFGRGAATPAPVPTDNVPAQPAGRVFLLDPENELPDVVAHPILLRRVHGRLIQQARPVALPRPLPDATAATSFLSRRVSAQLVRAAVAVDNGAGVWPRQ